MFWELDCNIKQNDAKEDKKRKFLPKFTKVIQNCAKTYPPFRLYNNCFAFKKMVYLKKNRRFNLWTCAVSWCVWKCPEWILNVSMHFYESLDDFWMVFRLLLTFFEPFLDHFWPYLRPYRAIFGLFFIPKHGHIGVILNHFGVDPGSFWGHLGISVASFWHHFGVLLTTFWGLLGPFWPTLDHFLGHVSPFLGHVYDHFECFWWHFWELDCNINQNDAKKHANFCRNSPKLCKIAVKHTHFRL